MAGFLPVRDRDAWATIRGYVYQVNLTIKHWLALQDNWVLELERGEDIDLVNSIISAGTAEERARLLAQTKHRETRLTLRAPEAIEALASFNEHLVTNPGLHLTYRFITNTEVGLERPSPWDDKIPALTVWQQLRTGQPSIDQTEALRGIRAILQPAAKPSDLNDDTWAHWRTFIDQADDTKLLEFIRLVDWSTNNLATDQLQNEIESTLQAQGHRAEVAKAIYQRLFLHVFRLLSNRGLKRLTVSDRTDLLSQPLLTEADKLFLEQINNSMLDLRVELSTLSKEVDLARIDVHDLGAKVKELATQKGIDVAINYSLYQPVLDAPPLVDKCSSRQDAVLRYTTAFSKETWCAVHGGLGAGKTHLAILVAQAMGTCRAWVRMRDVTVESANLLLDQVLFTISGNKPRPDWNNWCSEVVSGLQPNDLLVLDDLPKIQGGTVFEERLIGLARACHRQGVKIFSTSPHVVSLHMKGLLGPEIFLAEQIPPFSIREIEELLNLYGAPEIFLEEKFVTFLGAITKNHPQLLVAAVRYLHSGDWQLTISAFEQLLRGGYAGAYAEENQDWLIRTIADDSTRELLYRLNLVGSSFDQTDIKLVSDINPVISHPMERITQAVGVWIQRDSPNSYVASPLLSLLGSDNLTAQTQRETHLALARAISRRKVLGPREAMSTIAHFVGAEEVDQAGILLALVLNSFSELDEPKDHWGLTSIWYDMPLPRQMDPKICLMVRAAQVRAGHSIGKNTRVLLNDIDSYLEKIPPEHTDLRFAGATLGVVGHALDNPTESTRYALVAMQSAHAITGVVLKEGFEPAKLLWLATAGIKTPEQLLSWIKVVEQVPSDQVKAMTGSDWVETACFDLANGIWLNSEGDPDLDLAISILEDCATRSLKLGLVVLWMTLVRVMILILCQHKKDVASGVLRGQHALSVLPEDPRAALLIGEAVGSRLGTTPEAYTWLSLALSRETSSFPDVRIMALLGCSQVVVGADTKQAAGFTREAVHIASSTPGLSEAVRAQIFLEHAIAVWLAQDVNAAFEPLEIAVQQLLACKVDDVSWKALCVVYMHVIGYLSSLATYGAPPGALSDGEPYTAPFLGIAFHHSPLLGNRYQSQEWQMAALLSSYAEAVGNDASATAWALKLLDMTVESRNESWLATHGTKLIVTLLAGGQIAEALDTSLAAGANYAAIVKETQHGGNPLRPGFKATEILDPKPSEDWNTAEEQATVYGVIPLVLHLGVCYFKNADQCRTEVMAAIEVCRQISASSSAPWVWNEAAEILYEAFLKQTAPRALVAKGAEFRDNAPALQVAAYLGASLKLPVAEAAVLHVTALPYVYRTIGPRTGMLRRLAVPFVETFWSMRFEDNRFRFSAPRLVEHDLAAALALPAKGRSQTILRAITAGLGIHTGGNVHFQDWLKEGGL